MQSPLESTGLKYMAISTCDRARFKNIIIFQRGLPNLPERILIYILFFLPHEDVSVFVMFTILSAMSILVSVSCVTSITTMFNKPCLLKDLIM